MRTLLVGFLFTPVLAFAQPTFPTEFPPGAVTLSPDDLKQKLTGNVFNMTYANGAAVRLEFKETYVYVNSGNSSDSGKWRAEGSQLCIEWQRFQSGCSDMRMVESTLYVKRITNGEIVKMVLR
ncbi:MAG TPA: hypothetical protein PK347_09005 [Burkholderiaceae bacterium]|nr:hypothetical protein [Burkholderiaceae bacterium]